MRECSLVPGGSWLIGVGPVETRRLNGEVDVVCSGRLALECVCNLLNHSIHIGSGWGLLLPQGPDEPVPLFSPLQLGPGPNLIRAVGLFRSPPVPFHDKCGPCYPFWIHCLCVNGVLRLCGWPLGMSSSQSSVARWNCEVECREWTQSSKLLFFFFSSEGHLPICEVFVFCFFFLVFFFPPLPSFAFGSVPAIDFW